MLESKRFQNNETGEQVNVMQESGMFYSLSNGINIKKDIFFQKFSEVVDASSFFNTGPGLSTLAEKITKIDSSKVSNIDSAPSIVDRTQETLIEQTMPNASKDDLIRRYNEAQVKRPDTSQYKVFDDEDEAAEDFFRKQQQQAPQRKRPQQKEEYVEPLNEDNSFDRGVATPTEYPGVPGNIPSRSDGLYLAEQESFKFFKSFKRIHPIKLSIDFDEKIAEPNFIKMMSMNFEGDIIKYYTKEIMNRVYNDPGFLENKIYDKLKNLIMGEEKVKKPRVKKEIAPPPPPVKKPRAKAIKKEENNG